MTRHPGARSAPPAPLLLTPAARGPVRRLAPAPRCLALLALLLVLSGLRADGAWGATGESRSEPTSTSVAAKAPADPAPGGAPPERDASSPTTAPAQQPASDAARADPSGPGPVLVAAVAAALVSLLAALALATRPRPGGRGSPDADADADRGRAPADPSAPPRAAAPGPVHALGYVAVPDDAPEADWALDRQAGSIEAACAQRGWNLVELVRDHEEEHGSGSERPGLAYALEQIGEGEADCLVVSELRRLSPSAADVLEVLDLFDAAGARLVALDVALDTGEPEGRRVARAVAEVGAWERDRRAHRTREEVALQGPRRRRFGRPGGGEQPELRDRIVARWAEGWTLEAIADELNEEEVPPLLGDAAWDPSGIRAALGSRRRRRGRAGTRLAYPLADPDDDDREG